MTKEPLEKLIARLRQLDADFEVAHAEAFRGQPNRMPQIAYEVMGKLTELLDHLDPTAPARKRETHLPGTPVTVLRLGHLYQGEVEEVTIPRSGTPLYTVSVAGGQLGVVEPHEIVAVRKKEPCEVCSRPVPVDDPYDGFCSPGCVAVKGV